MPVNSDANASLSTTSLTENATNTAMDNTNRGNENALIYDTVNQGLDNQELNDQPLDNDDLEDDEDFDDHEDDQNEGYNEKSPHATVAKNTQRESKQDIYLSHQVDESQAGQRIDKLATELWQDFSRSQLQDWLKSGNLKVNDEPIKAKYRVKNGDRIELQAVLEQHGDDKPENIALDVIYEDDSVIVINKPVGMVVHPGAGNWSGTLVNGLLYHYPDQAHLPRAGLVHRIDKNTSGLLVIGRTKPAVMNLQAQLKDKSVYRHYRCVVAGDKASLTRQRLIDAPIGRHKVQRTKMTVTSSGRDAVTHLTQITALNESYSLLDVSLETGRTHQIRVHLSHIGHPIIGDDVYGHRQQLRAGLTEEQRVFIQTFPRQALHAYKLGFIHPKTDETVEFTAPLPEDILQLIDILNEGDPIHL